MKQKLSRQATYWLGVVAVGLVLGLSIQFVRAWTEPGGAAPDENVGAPINTGSLPQTKTGDLTVSRLGALTGTFTNAGTALVVPNGNVGIGTIDPQTKLHVAGNARITGLAGCSGNQNVEVDANGNLICGADETGGGGGGTFYLTSNVANGANADTLCDNGYHICGFSELFGRTWANKGNTLPVALSYEGWKDGKKEGMDCHTQCWDWSSTSAGQEACTGNFLNIALTESNCGQSHFAWCCSN